MEWGLQVVYWEGENSLTLTSLPSPEEAPGSSEATSPPPPPAPVIILGQGDPDLPGEV